MNEVTCGVILAGGRSSRMDGRDKALLGLAGETLLARVAARLKPSVAALCLNANGDPARFGAGVPEIVADHHGGFAGPLAGVAAGLRWARARVPGATRLVTVAVDTPFFPVDLVDRLAGASSGARIVVARSASGPHPTFALWPLALADALEAHLAAGAGARVLAFITARDHAFVDFPADAGYDCFFNINTPADLEAARAMVARLA